MTNNTKLFEDKILVLDFGSQYTNLIARRIRELNVYCEVYPYDIDIKKIQDFAPRGIILSGGPESTNSDSRYDIDRAIFELNVPVLGICYGMQIMANKLGGKVASSQIREFGYAKIDVKNYSELLSGLSNNTEDGNEILDVWMSHSDKVIEVSNDFIITASSKNCEIAAIENTKRKLYGLQFHPEVVHTKNGAEILSRFVKDICHCRALWYQTNIIEEIIDEIRTKVGKDKVVLGLSGGVDSSVVAALLSRAVGNQLVCIFVDTGLLRLNEVDQVLAAFSGHEIKIEVINAKKDFFDALKGVSDPEEKRKIIGALFIEIFRQYAPTDAKWLAQGTIYPDVIESAKSAHGKAHVIKSHHNVGGLPEEIGFKLLEPLRQLFKDEVRKIGTALGLPHDMIYRHPFPGPGLAVRVLGEVKEEYVDILRKADAIFIEELRKHDMYDKVNQAFTVFLPVKSVGVMGDGRKYDWVIALRAVETQDYMTAHWAHIPHQLLAHISQRIINEINGISRVVYDISDKPPATIEWE